MSRVQDLETQLAQAKKEEAANAKIRRQQILKDDTDLVKEFCNNYGLSQDKEGFLSIRFSAMDSDDSNRNSVEATKGKVQTFLSSLKEVNLIVQKSAGEDYQKGEGWHQDFHSDSGASYSASTTTYNAYLTIDPTQERFVEKLKYLVEGPKIDIAIRAVKAANLSANDPALSSLTQRQTELAVAAGAKGATLKPAG